MNLTAVDQTLQLISWFLALIELILALYVLVLNIRHTANRHVSGLLLLFAASNFALGLMLGATNEAQVALPIHAATTPAIQPALLLVAVVLLKPQWLRGRWRQIWWVVYGLAFLPILLTLMDIGLGTRLWYTGPDIETYAGGFVPLAEVTAGSLSQFIRVLNIYVMGIAPFIPALYVALRDKEVTPLTRRLAWLLLGAQLVATVLQIGLHRLLVGAVPLLITSTIFVLAYAYASFEQLILERRRQRGKLRTRLTALILVVTIPLLVAVVAFVSTRAAALIEQNAAERLGAINRALASSVSMWLDLNVKALQELASLPDITSMDPERQKPLLEAMAEAYPHMYLVSTTNLTGFNVARSDPLAFQNYGDHLWHIAARNGVPLTLEVVIGKATGLPALVASVPIIDKSGSIAGVAMFGSTLTGISEEVKASKVGETGFAYVVDMLDRVVAHPDRALFVELQEFDAYPPVSALRGGTRGAMTFTDDQGRRWRAYVDELDNGWGVIVQQQEAEWLVPLRLFQRISWTAAAAGAVVLLFLAGLTIRQALLPIGTLTDTASAIAAGDLTRVAQVESEDEIGILAHVFNSMTAQLRDLIGSLEQRVADQTRDLEHRAVQLEAAAQVAREAAEIRDVVQLLDATVRLISERFGFYHAGIFLLDERGEYAVLQAASSEGGQRMLARRHQLKVGQVGIVGYAAGTGEARIALDVGADAVFFNNPDLPNTRSEMAVPLKVREQVIGVLDVQSTHEAAFSDEDVAILQTMADQVALAIENARLLGESQRALRELETLYGQRVREAWRERTARTPAAYRYTGVGVEAAPHSLTPEMEAPPPQRWPVVVQGEDGRQLIASIRLRGQTLGSIILRQDPKEEPWSDEEIALVEEVSTQIGLALENARLLEETQQRAEREQALGQISARFTRSLNIDTMLQTAVRELGQLLPVKEISVQLEAPQMEPSPEESG